MSAENNSNNRPPVRPNIQTNNGKIPVRPNINNGNKVNKPVNSNNTPVKPNQDSRVNTQVNNNITSDKSDINNNKNNNTEVSIVIPKEESNSALKQNKKHIRKEKEKEESLNKIQELVAQAQKSDNKQVVVEDTNNEKKKKFPIILVIIPVVILIIILGAVVLSKVLVNDQHITLADQPPVIDEQEEIVDTNSNIDNTQENLQEEQNVIVGNTTEPYEATQNGNPIAINEEIIIPITVSAKLDGDEAYTDYYSYVTLKMKDIVMGYDNVMQYVNRYNENTTNRITLSDKETFYTPVDGEESTNELVMYTIEMTVPNDFPTQDTKNNKAYINPEIILEILGTEEEDSIITERYKFAIPNIIDISDDTSEIIVGETYNYRFVTTMPIDVNNDNYYLIMHYSDNTTFIDYKFDGIQILKTDGLKENNEVELNENTEYIRNKIIELTDNEGFNELTIEEKQEAIIKLLNELEEDGYIESYSIEDIKGLIKENN